ncbi:hypothetical protein PR202_ga15558 [Eleusine coracana subsp. coracana]|uniref:Homeobox-leucine zipper protein n=1 Tax=Eleusine coracana subsp. coracana TaxID=191504 RepID=A0AAV5CJZ3_ELECO|nr:hypothetical protein QOZ80_6BG0491610 [Eleusine coracana subsp. coracana]GJM98535.1 hypothetical protein PR202_ga15558 [Eleusine coracana subsp. coracana]
MKRPRGGSPSLLPMTSPDDDGYGGGVGMDAEGDAEEEMMACGGGGEKKRRLGADQVRALERSFEVENKLEPERKARLARDLGLQPRQVAVWFQNRRARWKTKQLERDYAALRHSYDALRHDHDALSRDKDALLAEIKELKAKLGGDEEATASFTSVKAEPAASDGQPPAGAGSSESDSSAVLNDADLAGATPLIEAPVQEIQQQQQQQGTLLAGPATAVLTAARQGEVFFHGGFLKVEEDETGFLDDGGFFAVEQPPPMAWWTESTEHWN